ncbi:MAG: hypothetical protein CM1200mP9_07840 [Gammaproteobacteria bacterium]|nr:MAG: hypothetical protein CM1200mP9_07840 [Gammaproteobacteria bacterium]
MRFITGFGLIACVSLLFPDFAFAQESESEEIEEIVVTGSYIKGQNQADLASPIDVVDLEDIAANGWSSIEDIAETLTFNTSSSGRTGLLPLAAARSEVLSSDRLARGRR